MSRRHILIPILLLAAGTASAHDSEEHGVTPEAERERARELRIAPGGVVAVHRHVAGDFRGTWPPNRQKTIKKRIFCVIVFWCRFWCLLGSILAPKLAQVGSKTDPAARFFKKSDFSKKGAPLQPQHGSALRTAPKTTQDRPKTAPRRS